MTDPFDVISPKDQMNDGGLAEYHKAGRLGLDLSKAALRDKRPRRILDFPSGHGRVLRWLHREWPDAELHAAEVDPDALEFVAKTFGAKTILSTSALDMPLPSEVDLIFCGSLMTHLDAWLCTKLIERCVDALSTDGVFVFTTHGRIAALLAEKRHEVYGTLVDTAELHKEYAARGFAYRPYDPRYPSYGLTLTSPTWIFEQVRRFPLARVVMFEEGGWGHQDVFAIRKNPWPMGV